MDLRVVRQLEARLEILRYDVRIFANSVEGKAMTLRSEVYESCKTCPRSLYDLVRSIALFVPEDHPFADAVRNCIKSLTYAPPENHRSHIVEMLMRLDFYFPEYAILTAPHWVKVICVLAGGGSPSTDELVERIRGDL